MEIVEKYRKVINDNIQSIHTFYVQQCHLFGQPQKTNGPITLDSLMNQLEKPLLDFDKHREHTFCGIVSNINPNKGGISQHFVPHASLDRHLIRCHGIQKKYLPYVRKLNDNIDSLIAQEEHKSNESLSQCVHTKRQEESVQLDPMTAYFESESEHELDSLLDSCDDEVDKNKSMTLHEFQTFLTSWKKIPREFQTPNMQYIDGKKLKGWIISEMERLFPHMEWDTEIMEFIVGMLYHPEFCHPDLVLMELHEILGKKTRVLVLALWKYLSLVIALQTTYKEINVLTTESLPPSTNLPSDTLHIHENRTQKLEEKEKTIDFDDLRQKRDYKRKSQSYRAKNTQKTKRTPLQVLRDLILHQMEVLSFCTGRELVQSNSTPLEVYRELKISKEKKRYIGKLMSFKDPIQVRDFKRREILNEESAPQCFTSRRSRSETRSRQNSRSETRSRVNSRSAERGRSRSYEKSGSKSKCKSRSRSNEKGRSKKKPKSKSKRRGSRSRSRSRRERKIKQRSNSNNRQARK